MIEKFLDKFLPQITERLNENEEVGKALIEALAVLDNYATINNVQFTDEQVNSMLGIVPEPEPEPNADIPAEIIQAEETAWTWRFKTKEELIGEYDAKWRGAWGSDSRDYLFGQPIPKTPETQEFIEEVIIPQAPVLDVDTETLFGISSPTSENWWGIDYMMITDKPLPTVTWNWRFKTAEEFKEEYGDDWESELGRESGLVWVNPNMNYLLGQKLEQNLYTEELISTLKDDFRVSDYVEIRRLGIEPEYVNENWTVSWSMFTNKPLPTAVTPSTQKGWNWRFKTEQELQQEWGLNRWKNKVAWNDSGKMDYLLGKPIIESDLSKQFIEDLLKSSAVSVDTNNNLGIDSGSRNTWTISEELVTNKPLPTAAAPAKSEPKKRGRKPKGTATAWTWRFKTEKELREEYGGKPTGSIPVTGSFTSSMFYLFGKPIEENNVSKKFIKKLKNEPYTLPMDTKNLGISNGVEDTYWSISFPMITDKPLPTAAAPAKTEPKKRGRKPKSELPEIDLGGLEDIGDIDIDDIDFDNLVI